MTSFVAANRDCNFYEAELTCPVPEWGSGHCLGVEARVVCMAEHLTPDWLDYIARFKELFLQLYHHPDLAHNEKKVNMTYKVHNLVDHLGDWFR